MIWIRMTNERTAFINMVSITWNTDSTHLIMDSNTDWTQCRDEATSITSSEACDKSIQTESVLLAGKSGQVSCTCLFHPGYFQCGLHEVFMVSNATYYHSWTTSDSRKEYWSYPYTPSEQKSLANGIALSSLNCIYFENHPGVHLYNKHSKPFMTDTTP